MSIWHANRPRPIPLTEIALLFASMRLQRLLNLEDHLSHFIGYAPASCAVINAARVLTP
jgi:hypothetical protein